MTSSNATWLVGGRVLSDALSFALFVLIAREFGPAGIGVYSFYFAISTIIHDVVTLGIAEYGVREYARGKPEARKRLISDLLGTQLLTTLVVVLIVVSIFLVGGFAVEHLLLFSAMLVYHVSFAIAGTFFIAPFASGRVQWQVGGEVLARAGTLLVAIVLLAVGDPTLSQVLIGYPMFGIALLAFATLVAQRFGCSVVPQLSRQKTISLLSALWSFAAVALLSTVFSRVGVVLLYLLASSVAAGVFASAFKFAEVGWMMLSMIPWAAYAMLATLRRTDPESFRTLSLDLLRATLLLTGVFAWGMFWVLPLVVPVLFGAAYEGTESALRGMVLLLMLFGADAYFVRMMLIADLQLALFRITLVQVLLAFAVGVALIPRMGMEGAIVALTVAQGGALLLQLGALRWEREFAQTVRILLIFALCVIAAAGGGAAVHAYGPAPLAAAVSLAIALLAARLGGLVPTAAFFNPGNS